MTFENFASASFAIQGRSEPQKTVRQSSPKLIGALKQLRSELGKKIDYLNLADNLAGNPDVLVRLD